MKHRSEDWGLYSSKQIALKYHSLKLWFDLTQISWHLHKDIFDWPINIIELLPETKVKPFSQFSGLKIVLAALFISQIFSGLFSL